MKGSWEEGGLMSDDWGRRGEWIVMKDLEVIALLSLPKPIFFNLSRISVFPAAPEGTYPHGIRSVFADIMRKEGPSALFRGLAPVMIRAFPANAACFLGYEAALKALNSVAPDL